MSDRLVDVSSSDEGADKTLSRPEAVEKVFEILHRAGVMDAFEAAIQELLAGGEEAADPITAMIRSLGGYEPEYVEVLRAELKLERERNRGVQAGAEQSEDMPSTSQGVVISISSSEDSESDERTSDERHNNKRKNRIQGKERRKRTRTYP